MCASVLRKLSNRERKGNFQLFMITNYSQITLNVWNIMIVLYDYRVWNIMFVLYDYRVWNIMFVLYDYRVWNSVGLQVLHQRDSS